MCAVILTSLRRVLSTFVLVCFLWTTLFQSFAFAGYERTFGDPTLIEQRGDTHFAHFSVGFQKMEDVPAQNDPALHAQFFPKKSPTLIIPIVRNEAHAELLFAQAFSDTPHILPTAVDGGLSFASDELDFYRENTSGDLVVSKTNLLHAVRSSPLHIYNDHGSTILDTDLPLDHLILSGKDVIQRGKQDIASLLLGIQGRFLNQEKFSVGKLVFDSVLSDTSAETSRESSRAPSPAFSTHSGVSTASSHSLGFANESNMTVREETAFGLAYPIQNSGTWVFHKDVTFNDDILLNETDTSVLEYHQVLKGTLHTLHNQGDFHVHGGFDDLQIQEFSNSGRLHGSGQLTLGTHEDDEDLLSINTGHILTDRLQLKLLRDFENRGTIQADTHLHTHGDVTFHQHGTLSGKAITINNRAFLNEASVDSPSLDLTFDENVETFHNAEDVTIATQSLTFARSVHDAAKLVNEGTINTKHFANTQNSLTNKHQIAVDVWDQRGKAVTNAPGGMIDVAHNAHFETDQMDNGGDVTLAHASGRLDHLTNTGGFTVQRGGLTCKTLRNARTMRLLDGEYHIDHLDNTGGEAIIDQLVLTSESPALNGTLTVHHMKPTQIPYTHITVDGTVDLQSGGFTTKALSLKGTLTLEKGRYHIDHFTGDKGAKLILKRGATVVIGNTEYDGDVISEVRLDLNLTHDKNASHVTALRRDYTARKTAFNALPTATPIKKPVLEETVFDTTKRINDAMSDYHRFDPTRSCDLNELQSRFKMRMGTEVTRIIYEPLRRDALDIQKMLPVLPSTDKLFGHFEITRLSSKVSHDIIQKITTDGMDILDSLSFYVPSFDADFGVIKRYRHDLTRDMFMLWLRDVLNEHEEGFTPYKFLKPSVLPPPPPPKESKQTGPFQTFRAPQSRPGNVTDLLSHHKERETAFNDVLKEMSTAATSVLEKTVLTASSNIVGILGQVSSRHATDREKKSILQTVIGSEITKVLHDEAKQQEIDLETHLPTVDKAHWSYRHFEILRLTAKVSRLLVQQVSGHGYDALAYVSTLLPEFDVDTDTLCTYSGIKRDLFLLWFREILEQHEEGFNHVTRASLTFLSPKVTSSTLSRFNVLGSKQELIVHLPGQNLATFLTHYPKNLKFNGKLTLHGESFIPTQNLTFGGHVEMHVDDYQNDKYDIAFSALDLFAGRLRNGKSNKKMASLRTFRPDKIKRKKIKSKGVNVKIEEEVPMPMHGYHLHVYAQGSVNTRYGTIHGAGTTHILSEYEDVLWGDAVTVPSRYYHRMYHDYCGNIAHGVTGYASNNAGISSDASLKITAKRGNIFGKYGFLFSSRALHLVAETLGRSITFTATQIDSGSSVYINGTEFNFGTQGVSTHGFGSYGGCHDIWNQVSQTEVADINCLGDLHLNVANVSITGNDLYVMGSIFKEDTEITEDYVTSLSISPLYCRGGCNGGNNIDASHGGRVFAGKDFKIKTKQVASNGFVSVGETITITSDEFNMYGVSHITAHRLAKGNIYTVMAEANKRKGGFIIENEDGSVTTRQRLSNSAAIVEDENAPVLNQDFLGFSGQRFLDGSLEKLFVQRMVAMTTGHLKSNVSADALLRRGQRYALNGDLVCPGGLNALNLPQSCLLYHYVNDKWALVLWVPDEEHDEDVHLTGLIKGKNSRITTTGDMTLRSGRIEMEERVINHVGGNMLLETLTYQEGTAHGTQTKLGLRAGFTGGIGIQDYIGKSKETAAAELIAGNEGIYEDINGHLVERTVATELNETYGHGRSKTTVRRVEKHGTRYQTTGNIEQYVGGSVHRTKVHSKAKKIIRVAGILQEGSTYTDVPDHDIEEVTTHSTHKGGGLFGKKTHVTENHGSSRSYGSVDESIEPIEITVLNGGKATLQQVDLLSGKTIIRAQNVELLQGVNDSWSSSSSTGKSLIYQSVSQKAARDRTYVAGKSNGPIEIHAENLLVEEVRGHVEKILPLIDLREGTLVTRYLDEIHERQEFAHESLTAECAVVIGLAISIATYGTCAEIGAGIAASATGATIATLTPAATIAGAMIGASIASLTSQAIIALANNKGDLGKAAKSLATKDTLKNIAIAAATSGIIKGIGYKLPTDGESVQKAAKAASEAEGLLETSDAHLFAAHTQSGLVHLGANVSVGTFFGSKPEDLIKTGALTAAASIVGGFASNKIASLRDEGTLGYTGHKLSHAVSGFVQDKIMGGNGVVGAATALGVEVVADAFVPHEEVKTSKHASAEVKKSLRKRISTAHNIGRIGAATAALLASQDSKSIGIGIQVASTVLEHNSRKTAQKYLGAAYDEDIDEEDSEQNPSKSTLTIGGKKLNTHTTAIDDGYESDTSKGLRLCYEKHKKRNDDSLAQGKKPSFLDNLRQFNAEQDYQERLEFKQGIYANQRAVKYAREHPAEVAAYAAGGTAIIASATITMPLSASLALGAGGAGLIEVGLKGGTVQSTQDLKDIGKAMILGALPSHKMKYLLPSSVVVGGLGYAFDDSTLMYGSAAIAGFSLALKGLTIAGKSVGNVIKSNPQASEIPLINASMTGHTTLPITRPAVNSNMPIKPTANTNVMPLPHVVEPIEVNGMRQLAQELSGGVRTTKDFRQIYFSAERSGAQGLESNGTLTLDGGTRTLNTSKTGSGKLVLDSSGNRSGSLGVFRQNSEGRWFLSANEHVSAKDLVQRPVDLIETTERTLASYQKMKATKNLSIQQQIDHVTGVDQASVRTQLFGTDKKPTVDPTRKKEELTNLRDSKKSRDKGMEIFQKRPKGQTLELSHNGGSRSAFDRKMNAFQDLANRSKLVKTKSMRNPDVTKEYRETLLDRVERDFGMSDPIKADNLSRRIKSMDADHLHELQLGGMDHSSMLSMLDKSVNRSVGVQIRHQLAKMPEGTPITKVIEKGTE